MGLSNIEDILQAGLDGETLPTPESRIAELLKEWIEQGGNIDDILVAGSNITLTKNPDGTITIAASGEVSSEDTVARAEIAAIKDGETLDSFGDVETALGDKQNTISDLSTIRSGAALGATAVQPETGKGLSTNDYTTAEKTKLAGIAQGAEVNVQSNWTQTTTTADDYIKNKPTLGTAAAKNATDTYNATGNDVTTGKAVAAALATLPEPMVFKGSLGTGGTITTLPTASSSNKGYVYKVITAGTYASQSAKVGDTFISDGSAWVLIPSGDEPSGTVTNVAVANGGGLTISGSPITSSGTITVGHSNSVTAKTSSSVKKFTYDANGHVTDSSELSTAESNALASGIDSTKVAQIETNKNNISCLIDTGAKNVINNTLTNGTVSSQVTATVDSNNLKVTLSGTTPSNADASFALSSNKSIPTGTYIGSGCPSGGATDKYRIDYIINDSTVYRDTGNGVEFTVSDGDVIRSQIVVYRGNTAPSAAFSPMVCLKTQYQASSAYIPYSPTNAELYTMIKALQS